MRKKGIQLSQGFGAVLIVVLIAVLVIIGIFIFVSLQNSAFVNIASASQTGEEITVTDIPGTFVSNATFCNFGSFSLTTAVNATGTLIESANYTTTGAGLVTNLTTQAGSAAAPWTINYTYLWGSEACTATDDLITQFGTYPALIGLIGTIIFLALVIGVLVASFVVGPRRRV